MEKIENNLNDLWEEITSKSSVSFKDIEKLKDNFGKTFLKIQRQRERLERSRDSYKKKLQEKMTYPHTLKGRVS